ncbi:MAG TPA: PsiF family protein [Steroidobacteraceae bacterium]|jgi:hypothetical protein|nr:PsiF family protein [Steroidobacteraceae bacterium]
MKILSALAACAIVYGGTALAADPPAAPSATPVRHPTLRVCNKQADARQLTGAPRAAFIRDCRAGKTG